MSDSSAAAVRERLSHPIVDIDGHITEYFPALARYLQEEGVDLASPSMQRLLPAAFGPQVSWHDLAPDQRARRRAVRPPWWGSPAQNTRDLATALFPSLLHERLDELGIDVSVVYPSVGLIFLHLEDEKERRGACRALNRYNAEAFRDLGDRLVPVAAIPMHTPSEALEAMEEAVEELGFKAILFAGYVQRPAAAVVDQYPEAASWAQWIDHYGIDSAYDYDPVWAACRRLGVPAAFHSGSIGWGSRMSISNYMYNHIGHLAEGQHAVAKSLFMGGVTRRFPEVNFAFLEGGVAWASTLLADLVGHWEKRNRDAIGRLDPATIDRALLDRLRTTYAGAWAGDQAVRANVAQRAEEDPTTMDEWEACEIERAEDIGELFVPSFYFGCEADDPMTTMAFNTQVNPFGARLNAMFGSDIAHWDVPDMTEVVGEAWEMVDRGLITEADFRDFTFANPVRYFTGTNPAFFKGTRVESDVDQVLAAERAG